MRSHEGSRGGVLGGGWGGGVEGKVKVGVQEVSYGNELGMGIRCRWGKVA